MHALGDRLPTRHHGNHSGEGGEQDQPERDAIDAEVVVDVEALDPEHFFDELEASGADFKAGVERQRDRQPEQGAQQRQPAHLLRTKVPPQDQQRDAKKDRNPNRKAQQTHVVILLSARRSRS